MLKYLYPYNGNLLRVYFFMDDDSPVVEWVEYKGLDLTDLLSDNTLIDIQKELVIHCTPLTTTPYEKE